jgi:hypothetical protein
MTNEAGNEKGARRGRRPEKPSELPNLVRKLRTCFCSSCTGGERCVWHASTWAHRFIAKIAEDMRTRTPPGDATIEPAFHVRLDTT